MAKQSRRNDPHRHESPRSARAQRPRAAARRPRTRRRAAAFLAIAAAVLALTGYFLKPVFFRSGPPPVAGNVIDIAADMAGFDRQVIRVYVGEPVTIRLTSRDNQFHLDGGGKHQFAVDELGINMIAPPEGSSYTTFTPTKPGTYVFYCDVCCGGRANPAMQGKLIVAG